MEFWYLKITGCAFTGCIRVEFPHFALRHPQRAFVSTGDVLTPVKSAAAHRMSKNDIQGPAFLQAPLRNQMHVGDAAMKNAETGARISGFTVFLLFGIITCNMF